MTLYLHPIAHLNARGPLVPNLNRQFSCSSVTDKLSLVSLCVRGCIKLLGYVYRAHLYSELRFSLARGVSGAQPSFMSQLLLSVHNEASYCFNKIPEQLFLWDMRQKSRLEIISVSSWSLVPQGATLGATWARGEQEGKLTMHEPLPYALRL